MNQISVSKAQPIADKKVISTQITISEEIEDVSNGKGWQGKWEEKYKIEAENLFLGLKQSLPQGTMHQLLIRMLQDKENLMVGI